MVNIFEKLKRFREERNEKATERRATLKVRMAEMQTLKDARRTEVARVEKIAGSARKQQLRRTKAEAGIAKAQVDILKQRVRAAQLRGQLNGRVIDVRNEQPAIKKEKKKGVVIQSTVPGKTRLNLGKFRVL